MIEVKWQDLKTFIDTRNISVQWISFENKYLVMALDGNFKLICDIDKEETAPSGSDQEDFENNYKPNGNQTFSDSTGIPLVRIKAFNNTDDLRFRGTGITGIATKNTSTNIDYRMPENRFINGADLILKDQEWGDSIKFQVVDIDNLLGYGAGVVLDEFGTDWQVVSDQQNQGQIIIPYPALVNAGLYIRIVYTSTGTVNDVSVKCNLFLHKKP